MQAPFTALAYDSRDLLTSVTDAMGGQWSWTYDPLQRNTAQTDPLGRTTTQSFDPAGQLVQLTDPSGHTTTYTRDGLGRVTREAHGQHEYTDFAYDLVGNLVSTTDALGNTTLFSYDNLYRRVRIDDPRGGVTLLAFDAVGNLTALTDPVGNTTTWAYDNLDRAIQETNELGHTRYYAWDLVGNLTAYTDRNGRMREFTHDALDRITQERWLNGQTVVRTINYQWDAASQLTAASDPDSAYQFTYDNLGRVIAASNAGTPGVPAVVLTSAYDSLDRRTSLAATINAVPDFKNTYQWDAASQLIRIEQTGQQGGNAVAPKRVDFAYNQVGQLASIVRYADLAGTNQVAATTFEYDHHRLVEMEHVRGTTSIAAYAWTYDDAGRVTTFVSPEGTSTYSYDQNGQLVLADHTGQPDEANTFDANGNRTGGGYVVGPNNRISSDGTFNYEYDNEGNLVRRTRISNDPADDYVMELEWDHRNRLTRAAFENNARRNPRGRLYVRRVRPPHWQVGRLGRPRPGPCRGRALCIRWDAYRSRL